MLSQVVLPLMNVSRRDMQGEIDPTEPNQQQIYISSAGNKGSYAYDKLIELSIQQIIAPWTTFCFGCDYRVPMQHGLLSRQFIEELKISQTYNEDAFAREYLSIWVGGSDESWIKYDNLSKHRIIVNSETKWKIRDDKEAFYYISVDVARIGVLTSIQVFKVIPKETFFLKKLVNSITLHDMHFSKQAIELKKLNKIYHPKEICIDGTGIGVGLMDYMVQDQLGEDGSIYEALASNNDDEYKKYPGDKIIYVLKANSSENSLIHSNCFTQITNGHVKFLIREQEAKSKLLATKVGSKMHPITRLKKLGPYIETTKLFEEICNLRIKNLQGNIQVEQINRKINKDRFSAFEYGLWRIKNFEDEYIKKKKRKKRDLSKFLLFSQGGR